MTASFQAWKETDTFWYNLRETMTKSAFYSSENRGLLHYVGDAFAKRVLLYRLIERNVTFRYRRSAAGVIWALLQPLSMTVVASLVFQKAQVNQLDGVPYSVFVFTGLLPWGFFSRSLNTASHSLRENSGIIRRFYFPRLLLPISMTSAALVDLILGLGYLAVLALYCGIAPTWKMTLLPLVIAWLWVAACAVSLWLSALDSLYREARYTFAFLTQLWFLGSPVFYSARAVPESLGWLYSLNPLCGVLETLRWTLLPYAALPPERVGLSLGMTMLFFLGGVIFFWRCDSLIPERV